MKPVLALLQFTTILPLGKPADFDAFAKNSWLYPIAGYVTGFISAIPAILAAVLGFDNSLVVAALTLAVSLFISGGNHFDGLLDFGDGLMAHGSTEKRIRAMTDRTTGAGALALGMITLLITFAALASLPAELIAAAVITAEVCGKMIMGDKNSCRLHQYQPVCIHHILGIFCQRTMQTYHISSSKQFFKATGYDSFGEFFFLFRCIGYHLHSKS